MIKWVFKIIICMINNSNILISNNNSNNSKYKYKIATICLIIISKIMYYKIIVKNKYRNSLEKEGNKKYFSIMNLKW